MLSEKNKTSKVNQYIKSDNTLYIIYADLEFLIKKIHGCGNNLEKASTTNIFLLDIQCQQFEDRIISKTKIFYIVENIV